MRLLMTAAFLCGIAAAADLRVAPFHVDATPPLGAPLIWVTPAARVADPLLAKGLLLQSDGKRLVLCAVDWCGLAGSSHRLLRDRMAAAAGPGATVTLHTVHQHTAPYVYGDASRLLAELSATPLAYPDSALEDLAARLGEAVRKAAGALQKVDSIGFGQAEVRQVASARRLTLNGKLATRWSTSGTDRAMAEAPEGDIDRVLRTITFRHKGKTIARLHYYATHPQTFCCEGTVSADIAGRAREAIEKEDGAVQVYFTGAAGNVTVGKYNDGSEARREELARRLQAGMRASIDATRFEAVRTVQWRSVPLSLPVRAESDPVLAHYRATLADPKAPVQDRYRAADAVAFAARREPLDLTALILNRATVLHLPGEPLLEFQRYAQQTASGQFIALAGYGDIGPGYLCPDRVFEEGGYEPSSSNAAPGTEAALKAAIRAALQTK